ncbi:MAG TPA: mucoidy inhibitor MuiA family protein, partial [Alphaproteobacteria bacterium]|nr:mucoidy inhibitor MuiA family protein [Alphaproteobacteria bacterium]
MARPIDIFIVPLLLFLLVLPTGVGAAELSPQAPIVAVTVFPDRAEVVRRAEVALPEGQSTLLFAGLPVSLFTDSVRIRAEGEGVLIGSVELETEFAQEAVREDERRLERELEGLRDQRGALEDRIAAAVVQLDFITAIGREMPKTANEDIVRGKIDPEAWKQALGLLGAGAAEAYGQIRSAETEKRTIERAIEQTEYRLAEIRTGQRAMLAARVSLEVSAPATVVLALSYQVPDATWRPTYEARLDSEAGKTRLVQIGEVQQRTGEDWSGVQLMLSTARPAQGVEMPELEPWFIDVVQIVPSEAQEMRKMSAADVRMELAGAAEAPEPVPPAPTLMGAVVATEFAALYRVPGSARVPADNAPHKFVISEHELETRLAVHIVPKLAPEAYLYGEMEYGGEEPKLPGPVAVFRDGAFIGTGAVDLLRPGEEFKLSFGVDDKVRLDYRLEAGERSREGLFDKERREERRYRIEVANHHARPIEITVLDQLPVPRDERIKIEMLDESTEPTETDVEGRTGVLAWTNSYEPNEERVIRFGYAVSYPED